MIRWKYVLPRLIVLGGLLVFLGNGLDPLLRWSIVTGGQSVIGGKVDVEAVSTSLGHSQIAAQNVAVTNPRSPDKNLASADYLWLDLDGAQLAHNRYIVREGVVRGLKINAARDASGALEPTEAGDDSEFAAAGRQWLEDAAKALGKGLTDELESVQLARELRARWPEEYEELESRIDAWLAQVKALEQLPEQLRGNVLEQAEQVRRAALTLKSLKEELASLRAEFQRLHQQARLDRTDLADAAGRDIERIKERLELARLEPATLSDYFLGPQLGPQTRATIQWVQWMREQIPASDVPQPQRGRGANILFAEYDPQPWLLVQSLQADGEIFWRGRPIPFAAVASDWTIQPTVHRRPAILKLKTTVPAESWIELTVDRTGLKKQDRLTFLCPSLPMPAQALGDEEYLAVDVPAGAVDVRATLSMVDDQIAGTLKVTRANVPLALTLGSKLEDSQLAARVQHRMRSVDQLEVLVTVAGAVNAPELSIESPLGDQMRLALRGALTEELAVRQEKLEAKMHREIDEEIASLQTELGTRKTAVMKKLNLADEQQQRVEQLVANAIGVPKGKLGRKLFDALR